MKSVRMFRRDGKNYFMPFLIGQCCLDQILAPEVDPQEDVSGKNEIIPFSNVQILIIPWTAARKARFGDAAVIYVEIEGDDGKFRHQYVEMVPDDILITTQYTGDLGELASGRAIIS
jgi:hypothetical protein